MLNFQGNGEQLYVEISRLLGDERMLNFICDRYFRNCDPDGKGAITLPAVAPLIQNILRAMGRPVSTDEVYAVWRTHCDPTMHHMTLESFRPFVSKLFQDYVDDCQKRAAAHAVVHRPAISMPAMVCEGSGRASGPGCRDNQRPAQPQYLAEGQAAAGYPTQMAFAPHVTAVAAAEPLGNVTAFGGSASEAGNAPPMNDLSQQQWPHAANPQTQAEAQVQWPQTGHWQQQAQAQGQQQRHVSSFGEHQPSRDQQPDAPAKMLPQCPPRSQPQQQQQAQSQPQQQHVPRNFEQQLSGEQQPEFPVQSSITGGASETIVQDASTTPVASRGQQRKAVDVIVQDARRSPPPPKARGVTQGAPAHWQSSASASKPQASSSAPRTQQDPAADAGVHSKKKDLLTEAFSLLPAEVHEFAAAAASDAFRLDPFRDNYEGRSTVLTSLEAALHIMNRLAAKLGDGAMFEDPEFGHSLAEPDSSALLYRRGDALPGASIPAMDDVVWLRPAETSTLCSFVGDMCSVTPGSFHDEWLLGALGVLALHGPALFGSDQLEQREPLGVYPRIFWDPELRRRGLYCFRFHKYGQWLYVIVDDRLPFSKSKGTALGARALNSSGDGDSGWMPLIEKAYAKLHGGYSALWSGLCDDALEDLTSWPTEVTRVSRYLGDASTKARDPGELWQMLVDELACGAILVCSKVDTAGAAAEAVENFGQLVHIDARLIGVEPTPAEGDIVSTGLIRSSAYAMLVAREVPTCSAAGEPLRLLRLRDVVGGGGGKRGDPCWRGRWGDDSEEWYEEPEPHAVIDALRVEAGSRFLPPCGRAGTSRHVRPQSPLWPAGKEGANEEQQSHDGTFVMRFDDWLQVFSHVLVSRPLEERLGWAKVCLSGCWTPETCGGTPIPVRQPVLASFEDWARNPQCRLVLLDDGGTGSGEVEVCASLMQPDARLQPGSTFPYEDRLLELFLCISQLDGPTQRLSTFDKRRVVKPPSLLRRRRGVLLRNKLRAPGAYAFVPSTWEAHLAPGVDQAPFRLLLHLRCPARSFRLEATSAEGWVVLEAPDGTVVE